MPQTRHTECHFTTSETVRDSVIGMSDGLTSLVLVGKYIWAVLTPPNSSTDHSSQRTYVRAIC